MMIPIQEILISIGETYPQFKNLKISEMISTRDGHYSYRLGSSYVLRFPSDEIYKSHVLKEAEILPKIALKLSVDISRPILLFKPNDLFPYSFSLMKWVDGDVVNNTNIDRYDLANRLAEVCVELRQCPSFDTWLCGQHNFYRGAHISVIEDETRELIETLEDIKQKKLFIDLLNGALKTEWKDKAVFIHGDINIHNLLVRNQKLIGLINFGFCGMGDPACDYAIAWTYFRANERIEFLNLLNVEASTFERSKVWALWKALLQKDNPKAKDEVCFTLEQIALDEKKKVNLDPL